MNNKNTGGPAFPREDYQTDDAPGQRGMDLRDYFASKAMQGFIQNKDWITPGNVSELAEDSYFFADAMLKAREK